LLWHGICYARVRTRDDLVILVFRDSPIPPSLLLPFSAFLLVRHLHSPFFRKGELREKHTETVRRGNRGCRESLMLGGRRPPKRGEIGDMAFKAPRRLCSGLWRFLVWLDV